jgi:hypothetical protein
MIFSFKKEENSVIGDNMVETGGHYAKWNKPGSEKQILCILTHIWILKQLNSEKQSRMVIIRDWGWGERGILVKG